MITATGADTTTVTAGANTRRSVHLIKSGLVRAMSGVHGDDCCSIGGSVPVPAGAECRGTGGQGKNPDQEYGNLTAQISGHEFQCSPVMGLTPER